MGVRKPFNDYIILGDITTLFDTKQSGEVYELIIDTEDLDRLKMFNHKWSASYREASDSYYATYCLYYNENGKRKPKTMYLHKYILDFNSNNLIHINHKNHNTLDNRKSNLEIINNIDNLTYRKSKNKNNTSGYRNVSLVDGLYIVQLQVEGKNTKLGTFDNAKDAGAFAEVMREKYYGEYKGVS